jgi:triosephosphate isomerase
MASDALVQAKAEAALAAGLGVIICVGETLEERDAGRGRRGRWAGGRLDPAMRRGGAGSGHRRQACRCL